MRARLVYGLIGEDDSDVDALKELVRRLAGNDTLQMKKKGFRGSGQMLKLGAKMLTAMGRSGCTRFVVCHDADGPDPRDKRKAVLDRIVRPAGVGDYCIVVPVQELEAWILADPNAINSVFSSWRPSVEKNPEAVRDPKEHLLRLARVAKPRPRYSPAVHNKKIARFLDLDLVRRRCPSFEPLARFVEGLPLPA